MISSEELFWNEKFNEEQRQIQLYYENLNYIADRPCNVYKPRLSIDGNQWCALFGDDLQGGVAGFGDSPQKAFEDFDRNWAKSIDS